MASYTKLCEIKIVRVKHRVTVPPETSVLDLMSNLRNIPNDSVVDEIIVHDDGVVTMDFHEERADK